MLASTRRVPKRDIYDIDDCPKACAKAVTLFYCGDDHMLYDTALRACSEDQVKAAILEACGT